MIPGLRSHHNIRCHNAQPTRIARLIMREAFRHNNNGWLDYDRSFRQQAAVDPSLPWNTLVPGLQASMILGNPIRQGFANKRQQCTLCRGFNHARSDCVYLIYTRTRALLRETRIGSAPPGTGEFECILAVAPFGMSVLRANSSTKLKTALRLLKPQCTNKSVLTPPPNRDSPNTYNHQYNIIALLS